eukprot:SAG31_NODE_1456_length_8264_cov_4.918570_4_plen_1194_part_00
MRGMPRQDSRGGTTIVMLLATASCCAVTERSDVRLSAGWPGSSSHVPPALRVFVSQDGYAMPLSGLKTEDDDCHQEAPEMPEDLALPVVPAASSVLTWLRSATVVQIQGCELNLLVQNRTAAAAWRSLGFDTVVFDSPDMHNIYFPAQTPVSEQQFAQVLADFKAAGFKIVFYTSLTNLGHSPLWQNGTLGRVHPEWSMRDATGRTIDIYGNPWLSPCSTAAVNESISYTEQLADKYRADGIMLDNNIYEQGFNGTAVDYCSACETKFRAYVTVRFGTRCRDFFGVDLADIHIPRNKQPSALYQLWIHWRNRVWAEEIIAFRQRFSPRNIAVAANILYLSPTWTFGSGLAPRYEDLVISESRSMTPSYLSNKAAFSFTAASSADHPLFDYVGLIVESGRVATCIDQQLLPSETLIRDLTSSWMHGTRPWCFSGGLIPVNATGNRTLNPWSAKNSASLAAFEHLLHWFTMKKPSSLPPAVLPVAGQVAYLSSFASRDVAGMAQIPNSASVLRAIGVPAAFLSDLFVTATQLSKCHVLLIEDVCCISAGLRDSIVEWGSTGGHTLVMWPGTATQDEIGRVQPTDRTLLGRIAQAQDAGTFKGHFIQGTIEDAAVQQVLQPYSWTRGSSRSNWDIVPYTKPHAVRGSNCRQSDVHVHFSSRSDQYAYGYVPCPAALPFPYGSDLLGHFCCSVHAKVPAPGHAAGCPSGALCCASPGTKLGCQGAQLCAQDGPASMLQLITPLDEGCSIQHIGLSSPLLSESNISHTISSFDACSGHVNVSSAPAYGLLEIKFAEASCPSPVDPPAPHSLSDWLAKRQLLTKGIFGTPQLPKRSLPDTTTTLGNISVIVWNMTTKFEITSSVFYSPATPGKRSSSAFLMHHGHTNCICPTNAQTKCIADNPSLPPSLVETRSAPNGSCFARCAPGCRSTIGLGGKAGGGSWWDLYNVSSFLHQMGYDVFLLSMPLKGINVMDGIPSNHDWFRAWEEKGDHPLRYFVEPCILTVNYAEELGYKHIHMMGLSGGGWTTTAAAAIDARIENSFPVAGTMPCALPWTPSAGGDYEQDCRGFHEPHGRPVYNDCDYLCWYVLGGLEEGRFQLQILHEHDDCCFSTHDRHDVFRAYEQTVVNELRGASNRSGTFAVSASNHTHHEVCEMDKIIVRAGLKLGATALTKLPCDILHGSAEPCGSFGNGTEAPRSS